MFGHFLPWEVVWHFLSFIFNEPEMKHLETQKRDNIGEINTTPFQRADRLGEGQAVRTRQPSTAWVSVITWERKETEGGR